MGTVHTVAVHFRYARYMRRLANEFLCRNPIAVETHFRCAWLMLFTGSAISPESGLLGTKQFLDMMMHWLRGSSLVVHTCHVVLNLYKTCRQ